MTWINVSDRLPNIKDNEYVLFWDSEVCLSVPCFGRRNENGEWIDESSVDNCGDPSPRYCVTYWMPLPKAPTANAVEAGATEADVQRQPCNTASTPLMYKNGGRFANCSGDLD